MKVYIDSEYKCHTSNPDGSFREIDSPFFDDKCAAFIEGYRLIPSGESWTREDGVEFQGEMVVPWRDYNSLYTAQLEYKLEKMAEYEELINELYSEVTAE